MTDASASLPDLERLFTRNLLSRRDFVAAVAALGLPVSAVASLLGQDVHVEAQAPETAGSDRHLVIIVMDGYRNDYLSLAPMHHLHALMARGMSYPRAWVGHLESETPTGHATIVTGVYPRQHSVIGFGWRDLAENVFTFMPTNMGQINSGQLAQTIAGSGVPTISDLVHARNQHDISVSVSGEKYYASASMGAGADYIFYGKDDAKGVFRPVPIGPNNRPPLDLYASVKGQSDFQSQDYFAADLAVHLARALKPRVLLVNLPDTDIAGHYYGGMVDPHDMSAVIKGADESIGRIVAAYASMGLLSKTVFVVTADHGMVANKQIVPIHPMYNTVAANAKSGTQDEEFRVSMGSVWMKQPSENPRVAAAMVAQHFRGIEGALYKVKTGNGWSFVPDPTTASALGQNLLHAYLNLAATEACPAGPEVIFPYAEDTIGLSVKNRKSWGQHGGFSWGSQHIPLVIAGPGIRHGVSSFPAKLVDIAPTAERLLGLPLPPGRDGVVLADALSQPSGAERNAQHEVYSSRAADVTILAAHSRSQR